MNIKIILLLFIAMLSVSTSPIIARYLGDVQAVTISFWRMGLGALVLWSIGLVKKQVPLRSENLIRTIIAGIFLGIHFTLFFNSIKLTTIANATFLGTLAPLITFIIEKYFLKRNHAPGLILGLVLAVCGAVIIVGHRFDFSSAYTIGNLLAVACSIFLGVSFIISENVRKEVGTISYARTLFSAAAFTLIIIAFFTGTDLMKFSSNDFYGLLLLGIIPTIFGHGFLYYAIRYVSPTVVASTPMGEPIIASIMAWFLFQELVEFSTVIGASITFLGLILLARQK